MSRLPFLLLLTVTAITIAAAQPPLAAEDKPSELPAAGDDDDPFGAPNTKGDDPPSDADGPDPFAEPKAAGKRAPAAKGGTERMADARTPNIVDVRKALAEKTLMDFVDTPILDAIETLRDFHRINIYVDQTALEQAAVGIGEPVNLSIADISLGAGLRHLLRGHGLTWTVENEMLVITSFEKLADRLNTRVYDVADLVESERPVEGDWWNADLTIELITATLEPGSWDDVGGPASIAFHDGMLVVSQTDAIHDQLRRFLQALRNAKSVSAADSPKRPAVIETRDRPEEAAIREALRQTADFSFTDKPLQEVIGTLRKQHKLPIVIEGQSFAKAGVSVDEPVTLVVHNVTLESALGSILKTWDLSYSVSDEALVIHTGDYEDLLDIKLYPVADLLAPEDEDLAIEFPRPRSYLPGCNGSSEELIEAITATISPASWNEVGGYGSINFFNKGKSLVVAQSQEVHGQLETLLVDLRKAHRGRNPQAHSAKEERADDVQLVIYRLRPFSFNNPRPSEEELVKLIKDLIEPKSWQVEGEMYLRALTDTLVIRHQRKVHQQIRKLLQELDVIQPRISGGSFGSGGTPSGGGFGGGGFH